jgi:hypothetical protein
MPLTYHHTLFMIIESKARGISGASGCQAVGSLLATRQDGSVDVQKIFGAMHISAMLSREEKRDSLSHSSRLARLPPL